ncbi:phenylalanine--tRNA ligase beta subunit-related protein [Bifidobacterium sp. ESL0763]|uniref:B3/B4 domain-containing protein n=1 Tax=Bifidobacterium sp. ESL0763 TaxID=2983227 RepID=UPI0023F68711|nr:phenylalanine--tRNA ligase beta subunit-related protein [Bifidobacterium sp. ESL0763]MDF7663730.1 phenylalanine--tRNA ligase beta subunit-related protein [Bifidobacterium sp. ESL0763]
MTKKFTVEEPFWDIFPDVHIAVLVAKGIDNSDYGRVPKDLLAKANKTALKWVPDARISANPVVADWREAFRKFKTKKGARCAVENLLKRAANDKGVGHINPAVDMYNSVSLDWAFPIGGEDLDNIDGDIRLTVARGGEKFWPISEADGEAQEALPGEVIYADDHSVLTRCLAWRDSARAEATENSHNIIFYMENINPERAEDHQKAMDELKQKIHDYFGVDATSWIVSRDNPSIEVY